MPARRFEVSDVEAFTKAMYADPEHQKLKPLDFLLEPKSEMKVWEDEQGPVFYFRISRDIRVDIQFRADVEKERTQKAMKEGIEWLASEEEVKNNFRGIVFDSVFRPLIAFAKRRLQFKSYPDLRRSL